MEVLIDPINTQTEIDTLRSHSLLPCCSPFGFWPAVKHEVVSSSPCACLTSLPSPHCSPSRSSHVCRTLYAVPLIFVCTLFVSMKLQIVDVFSRLHPLLPTWPRQIQKDLLSVSRASAMCVMITQSKLRATCSHRILILAVTRHLWFYLLVGGLDIRHRVGEVG